MLGGKGKHLKTFCPRETVGTDVGETEKWRERIKDPTQFAVGGNSFFRSLVPRTRAW